MSVANRSGNTHLGTVLDGYSACAGRSESGWYAGILTVEDVDGPFLAGRAGPEERVRDNARRWAAAYRRVRRRIVLTTPEASLDTHDSGTMSEREIAVADLIDGPTCPKETVPGSVLVWTERNGGSWSVRLWHEGAARTLRRSPRVLRNPRVAWIRTGEDHRNERDHGTPICAWEEGIERGDRIVLSDSSGRVLYRCDGRNPRLAGSGDRLFLLVEVPGPNDVVLRLESFGMAEGGNDGSELRLAAEGSEEIRGSEPYTFNADIVADGNGGAYIVAECCNSFGTDDRLGLHRDLKAWKYGPAEGLEDISGAAGRLPVERRAFNYWSTENLPPIRPRIFLESHHPVVTFRQFRHFDFKTSGWDIFWTELTSDDSVDDWSEPVRISEYLTTPDTGYGMVPAEDDTSAESKRVWVLPDAENDGRYSRFYSHRVEVFETESSYALDPCVIEEEHLDEYFVPRSYADIAPEPSASVKGYDGRTLVWGDLHSHTNYSKCVSAMDGCPDEIFRYCRDVLGCRVFTFLDHSMMMSGPENTWLSDRLEILADQGCVVLFGTEPGSLPGRHTNWYAHDRGVYDALRCFLDGGSEGHDRLGAYSQVMTELPLGSVIALRHFHGQLMDDDELLQTYEPRLEPAMEAMQGRINALIKPEGRFPLFPNQFLDQGVKIGLVGGSDHFRANGPNRFCLTGFWVKEVTPEGVWEAVVHRHTIAMSDSKIAMSAFLDGRPSGSAVTVLREAGVKVSLSASCGHGIRRACLIRDGEQLEWAEIGAPTIEVELVDADPAPGPHWYVPTVEVDTAYGSDNQGYGHCSPFFVHVSETD